MRLPIRYFVYGVIKAVIITDSAAALGRGEVVCECVCVCVCVYMCV